MGMTWQEKRGDIGREEETGGQMGLEDWLGDAGV